MIAVILVYIALSFLLAMVLTSLIRRAATIRLTGALVEAVSSHGLDNLTVQVVAAGTAALFL